MSKFKYQSLQISLEQGIKQGVFNSKLPSVRQLANERKVSIATVQKAYEALERMGLIEAKPKKGYFVKQQSRAEIGDYGVKYQKVTSKRAQEQQVLFSLNDDKLIPLSSTAPSSVINNQALLTKHHKKAFDKAIYRFQIEDEVQGALSLRQSLSQMLLRQGQSINPDDIHITSGRREALLIALIATGALAATVAVESPTSFYFQSVLSRVCQSVVEIPMQADYQQELALLEQAHVETGFSCYLVNPSFNDPTGRCLSSEDKLALLQWAKGKGVTLIEYDRSELYLGATKPQSLTMLAAQVQGVKVIGIQDFFDTVSTRICLGFMLAVNCNKALLNTKHTLTEEPNLHTQHLVNLLISSGDYELMLDKLRVQLRLNYQQCLALLAKYLPSKILFNKVDGGPCLWFKADKPSKELWHALVVKGVAIAPGGMFGVNKEFEPYFRITFALPWNTELATAIVKVCKALG